MYIYIDVYIYIYILYIYIYIYIYIVKFVNTVNKLFDKQIMKKQKKIMTK